MNWARKLIEPRGCGNCKHGCCHDHDGDREIISATRCDGCGWEAPADELELYNGSLLCRDCLDDALGADNADEEDLDENNEEEADDDDPV